MKIQKGSVTNTKLPQTFNFTVKNKNDAKETFEVSNVKNNAETETSVNLKLGATYTITEKQIIMLVMEKLIHQNK